MPWPAEMGPENVSSRLATVGLVGLVALNVVLVGVALRSNHTSGIDTSPVSPALASTGVAVSPSPTPSDTPSTTATPTATASATAAKSLAAPLQTMLVAVDNQRAWRVHAGSCSAGGATLATTIDGGKTWSDAKAPLRMIVRVRPTDDQNAFIVGAGSSCATELQSTADGGGTWGSLADVGNAWFRDPKDTKVVAAPGSSTSRPCGARAVLDLAVISTGTARVLCADGTTRSTSDSGSSWTDSGKVTGAVALAVLPANPDQTYVARLNPRSCAGVQVQRVDQKDATACIATAVPKGPGQISLSLVDGGGWVAIGDQTMRSTDGLVTWSRP
ncbi:MAG: hypothetical protein HHJ11_11480 [Phycicoccus sp.]|nr:hypothetical protein [Phycicoccus sp.]NMM34904.1 hypothetical protein [Phycicoccus sp.]